MMSYLLWIICGGEEKESAATTCMWIFHGHSASVFSLWALKWCTGPLVSVNITYLNSVSRMQCGYCPSFLVHLWLLNNLTGNKNQSLSLDTSKPPRCILVILQTFPASLFPLPGLTLTACWVEPWPGRFAGSSLFPSPSPHLPSTPTLPSPSSLPFGSLSLWFTDTSDTVSGQL